MKAVFLDAGGVFLFPDEDRVLHLLRAAGSPSWPPDTLLLHHLAMRRVDAERDGESYWPAYLEAAGIKAGPALFDEARAIPWSTASRQATDDVRVVAEAGVVLAVVSNSEGGVEAELRRHGIAHVGTGPGVSLRAVVMSSSVGVAKPDPRIFQYALEACDAVPAESIHVGDSVYFDVEGARAAGIRGIHLDPLQLCSDGTHEHIVSLAALVGAAIRADTHMEETVGS